MCIALAALVSLSAIAAAQGASDHPLVRRYPNAVLADKKEEAFARLRLVTGIDPAKTQEFVSQDVEGRLTRISYQNPRGRSVEEIFANYAQALTGAGMTERWRCRDSECGPAFAASRWNRFNGTINLGSDSRYLVGSLQTAGGLAHVALAINPQTHQLTIIEVKAMEAGLVKVDPAALGRDLDRLGRVAIPGVFFETGQAALRPESEEALRAMATILKERPQLNAWVVGHTDWTGAFDLNMRLSDARAKAVAAELAARHGIAAARIAGYGVGPLAPAASNAGDGGRSTNRRVELVARPQ